MKTLPATADLRVTSAIPAVATGDPDPSSVGFGAANAHGARAARGPALLLLHSHDPGARSVIARRLTGAEIRVRQSAFSLMAAMPSAHPDALRERAAASAACARVLRGA